MRDTAGGSSDAWHPSHCDIPRRRKGEIDNPNAEQLTNGDGLIADESNNRVIEVNPRTYEVVWQYPMTPDPLLLNGAAVASRLPDGNTLITDSNNNRIIEVTQAGQIELRREC